MGRMPDRAARRMASSESVAVPEGQPRTLRRGMTISDGDTSMLSGPTPITMSVPSTHRPATSGVIDLVSGAVASMVFAPPNFWRASAGLAALVST